MLFIFIYLNYYIITCLVLVMVQPPAYNLIILFHPLDISHGVFYCLSKRTCSRAQIRVLLSERLQLKVKINKNIGYCFSP